MAVLSISDQPSSNSLNAAYRPVILKCKVASDTPVVYCDVYFNDAFYKTLTKTQGYAVASQEFEFSFDIQDTCQEYLSKYLAKNGGSELVKPDSILMRIYCRFRGSSLDANSFIIPEGVIPVQATGSKPSQRGTGLESNSFFALNSALQHESNQDFASHLNYYKKGIWSADVYPLTHRPDKYKICPLNSDYFPFVDIQDRYYKCLVLNYRLKGQREFTKTSNCSWATVITWEPSDPSCVKAPTCPDGYRLSQDLLSCIKVDQTKPGPATYPPTPLNNGLQEYITRTRFINGEPDGYKEPNLPGGKNPYFQPVQNIESCKPGEIVLNNFDYLVVRYVWTDVAGRDLDTITGLIETGTAFDNDWVGWSQGDARVPAQATDPYIYWGGDNTVSGVESAMINFKKFTDDNPQVGNTVKVQMNAFWYGEHRSGDIIAELTTYFGGTMQKNGTDFINVGGQLVDQIQLPTNIAVQTRTSNINTSDKVAIVTYNKTTKSADIQLI